MAGASGVPTDVAISRLKTSSDISAIEISPKGRRGRIGSSSEAIVAPRVRGIAFVAQEQRGLARRRRLLFDPTGSAS